MDHGSTPSQQAIDLSAEPYGSASCAVIALYTARRLVPQARDGRFQVGITAAMKPGRHDWSDMGGALSQPRECSAESLRPPEIVGEIENPMLEAMRRL